MERRAFLKYTLKTASLGLVASHLTGCLEGMVDDLGYQGGNPFLHGVASGDPLANQVIIWTRISQDSQYNFTTIPVGYAVATDAQFKNVVAKGLTQANANKDFTVKVDVTFPKDNTTYYYAFEALGYRSVIGRTRTAPHQTADLEQARFAVCSCSNLAFGYFNAYAHIAKRADLTAVIHLGDYIYEYQKEICDPFLATQRIVDPPHEIITLNDYRRRYASYRRDPDLQECHRQHPWIVVWDDHEFANDAWMQGAQNHQANEGDFEVRKLAAVQAYREWMPIRDAADTTLSSDLRIFRNFSFGKLIDLNMLDTRMFGREKQNINQTADPKRSLLGLEQENWLTFQLLAANQRNAQWKLLGQQIILSPFKGSVATNNGDIWNGYMAARERLLDVITNNKIDNTVILTGDYHISLAFDVCKNPFDINYYNPNTGEGSIAVEYVCPAVTSIALPEVAGPILNPHQKFNDQIHPGYMLIDVTKAHCQCEWYFVNTLYQRNDNAYLAKALKTQSGNNYLQTTVASLPMLNMPSLAPADYPQKLSS